MKNILKIVLLIASCAIFSSTSYANSHQYQLAKDIANNAKEGLIEDYGRFPIQLDDISYLMNITSNKQYVVYDYKITMNSKGFTEALLAESLKVTLEDEICYEPEFLSIFRKNDLLLKYRYKFSDKKIIPVILSVDDICE